MRNIPLAALALVILGVAGSHQAKASIITTLTSVAPAGGGLTAFTYTVVLTTDQQIDSVNQAFGTVYDFGPVSGSITDTGLLATDGFVFTESLINTPAFLTGPVDNPSILNIRFTAPSGTVVSGDGTGTTLGTFTADSVNSFTTLANFDGQATKYSPGSPADNTETGNVGFVAVPSSVPEPASMFMLGSGLLALGYLGSRRRHKV